MNLSILLKFFDDYLIKKYPETESVEEAYVKYLEEINKANSFQEIGKAIQIDSTKIKELLFLLTPEFTHSFWTCGLTRKSSLKEEKKELYFGFNINASDELICFLESLGLEYKYLQYYYDRFVFVMDIDPRLTYGFHKNYKEYDFSKNDIRLLAAIHYVTLNMPYVKY